MKRLLLLYLLTLVVLTSGCSPLFFYIIGSGNTSSSDNISSDEVFYGYNSESNEKNLPSESGSNQSSKSTDEEPSSQKPSNDTPAIETPKNSIKNYYYTRLSDLQKVIYEKIEIAMISLSQYATVNSDVSKNDVYLAYFAYRLDNPQIYYIPSEYSYATTKKGTTAITKIEFKYPYSGSEIDALNKKLDGFVKDALSRINSSMSEFEKELTLHDYITDRVVYSSNTENNEVYTVIGVVNGSVVCEGYAKMIKLLLDKAGISTIVVTGFASNGNGENVAHAWNIVLISGQYYHLDATFNDTSVSEKGQTLLLYNALDSSKSIPLHSYQYFNLDDDIIKKTHKIASPDPEYDSVWFSVPVCSSIAMNYYLQTGSYPKTIADLENVLDSKLKEAKSTGYYSFHIKSGLLDENSFKAALSSSCRKNKISIKTYQIYGFTNENLFSKGCLVVLKLT